MKIPIKIFERKLSPPDSQWGSPSKTRTRGPGAPERTRHARSFPPAPPRVCVRVRACTSTRTCRCTTRCAHWCACVCTRAVLAACVHACQLHCACTHKCVRMRVYARQRARACPVHVCVHTRVADLRGLPVAPGRPSLTCPLLNPAASRLRLRNPPEASSSLSFLKSLLFCLKPPRSQNSLRGDIRNKK